MCTGSCSAARQGLPDDRQSPPWVPLEPFKNKAFKMKRQGPGKRILPGRDKAPARGACREGQPRHFKKLAAMHRTSLQGPVSDKLLDSTRRRPRQGTRRGPLPLCTHAPAHPPACRHEASSGARGGSLCSQGYAVASGDEEKAIVANGGAPNGHFLHCLGNSDGHSMTLSPAVRVR